MLRRWIHRRLEAEAERLGASMDYLKFIADTSLPAFLAFAAFMPMARRRRVLPPNVYAVAHLVSAHAADCGDCVQIAVNQARQAGIAPEHVRSILENRPEALPTVLAEPFAFARAVIHRDDAPDPHRERLRSRYGNEGLIELGYALAAGGVYPVIKRALGYDTACRLPDLNLEGTAPARNGQVRPAVPTA
ncbi:hypothetical protein GQ464_011350 [Rhodocaloribacter litoris]|uniref:carboxymuconolactone decarboxylase family protein n=1 Tax=Rhodocaloribacter litoris TaxID=2558931 RepID=UPI001423E1F1|nr:carboxymuconolactone decarboxylase family protein [Rhodocaloribacter litoris]QXD14054.1 hypothetical protein GQ464_011350 [Rhodocaloribacter litoris]GIV60772.1 MAG: hypothetical protein KatS3mg043_1861 [Rhodothermaceae bacterium]